ncbi:GH1 family beta-glucosidase [Alicyclobacillus sp. ALC3]|uniref:GH1 family beta-glucosidase n=1 Tax=Alicyclobacillus sp. ALC3 TaxID=2796143 RepID=UPI002378E26C|nr:GH1 family beta-glucosidase [Alicyclobacillus sp. ALC3]WDL97905.1 beta-glucosidase [Alicyclobacillus sp. ALC3]
MSTNESTRAFPKGFLWGVATASYQIEGAVNEAGRVPSIWDTFSHTPGKVFNGDTGDIACDNYHRYSEDIQQISDLGAHSYRLSLSWPRIMTETGQVNQAGLDHYKRLIDELLERGIDPAVTLYHWDLPQWIEDDGGWLNRDTVGYYTQYVETVFRHLNDTVPKFITQNEPWCASMLGYGLGHHAPGLRDWRKAYRAAHHLLLSHGEAVKLYRAMGGKGQIGITLNLTHVYPGSSSEADVAAARRQDIFLNRWFLDPLTKGSYPSEYFERLRPFVGPLDFIRDEDMESISTEFDFLGVNFYNPAHVVDDPEDNSLTGVKQVSTGRERTAMGWEIEPEGLYDLLKRLQDCTDKPLYITENGAAFEDVVVDGRVADTERIAYLHGHIAALQRFVAEGGNLKGYYVWSLLDNFEWAFGYSKRFGLIYVDFETQQRIRKDSFTWFGQLVAGNGLPAMARSIE